MEHDTKLTAGEVANLWTSYMHDSMCICVFDHFLENVQDEEIKNTLDFAKELSASHLPKIEEIFNKEEIAIPQGFTDKDIYKAPRLFTDVFYTRYLECMSRNGLIANSLCLGTAYREDIKTIYQTIINEAEELYNQTNNLLKEKGALVRSPIIHYPQKVTYVQDESFVGGTFSFTKRPLLAIEVAHIANNIESSQIYKALIMGFSQVAESDKVRKHLRESINDTDKFIDDLKEFLEHAEIAAPMTSDDSITNSTTSPFSDKLMMFIISTLNEFSISLVGTSLGASARSDLAANYMKFVSHLSKFALEGTKLMIGNGWLERPPQTLDRNNLMKK
ncbi:DUF3231 family protein [Virgibacillus sp. L01]|uniref:DUF3231 family protein n=1 Tax=Virgibacillus sp. L01 TaxID=3457429 RepID=UPI003FD64862